MSRGPLAFLMLAALSAAIPGCGRPSSTAPNPVAIDPAEYEQVFDASVDVLREMRFTLDRRDQRYGVVTTQPLIASSVFEPWYTDNTSASQVLESTANLQRRSVRIEITPPGVDAPGAQRDPNAPAITGDERRLGRRAAAAAPAPPPLPTVPPAGPAADPARYQMEVAVTVERRYHAPEELNNTVIASTSMREVNERYRPQTTERGNVGSTWVVQGRDAELERRLVEMILARAAVPRPEPEPVAPTPVTRPKPAPAPTPDPAPQPKPETAPPAPPVAPPAPRPDDPMLKTPPSPQQPSPKPGE